MLLASSVLALALLATPPAADTPPAETPAQRDARLAWWRDARFGLFIHWGPVSLKGTEIGWSRAGERRGYRFGPGKEVPAAEYDNLFKKFNPVEFDAKEWVALAQDAGMKYMVFTTRHHDGFSMFDTKASDYRITSPESPYRRDVVKELADACAAAKFPFGMYYSQPDWHHPDAFTDRHANYLAYLKAQLKELMSNYGKVAVLFFDGLGQPASAYDGAGLVQLVRKFQPQIVINDRTGLPEDYSTPEQTIGGFRLDRPWETCMTLGDQWSYKPDDRVKSLETCVRTLVRCAGGDGNFLFNVGPMPDGRIEPRQADRLREIGAWLKTHGESIHGTRGGPLKPTDRLATTRKGNTVFVHAFAIDGETLRLPALPARVTKATVLATGAPVAFDSSADALTLTIPRAAQEPIVTVIRLDLDTPALTLPPAIP